MVVGSWLVLGDVNVPSTDQGHLMARQREREAGREREGLGEREGDLIMKVL